MVRKRSSIDEGFQSHCRMLGWGYLREAGKVEVCSQMCGDDKIQSMTVAVGGPDGAYQSS